MEPTVSVCITTYNHGKFIAKAIESILAQKIDFPIEILIGEDASTDDTRSIVENFVRQYPEIIRPFYHGREGKLVINGRITGRKNLVNNLLNAKGKYVILLDGDDFWLDNGKLTHQVMFLDRNPDYVACFHNAIHVDEEDRFCDRLAVHLEQVDFTLEDILRTNPIPTMTCLFRNPYYKELPEWFYKTDMGDWPVHILNAQRGKLHYFPMVMAAYRIHDNGAWKTFREDTTKSLYSQIRVWKILLAEAGLGKDALIVALIIKNYERIIRTGRRLGKYDEVIRYLRERREYSGNIGWYDIKYEFIARLKSKFR